MGKLERLLLQIRDDPNQSAQIKADAILALQEHNLSLQKEEFNLLSLRSALDHISSRIYIKGLDGRFIYNNKEHLNALGVQTQAQAIGKLDSDLRSVEMSKESREEDLHVLLTKKPMLNKRVEQVSPFGKKQHLLSSKYPILNSNDEIVGLIGVTKDITDIKVLEEKVLHSQRVDSIGILAGGLAHDFNNILTAVYGFSSLLQSEKLSAEQANFVAQITSAAERAKMLTRKFLQFGRQDDSQFKSVKLDDIIGDATKLLSGTLYGRHISITTTIEPNTYSINADTTQINQVLLNLCLNASDAMPNGGNVSISLYTSILSNYSAKTLKTNPGEYLVLEVKDTGTGMSEEVKSKIFDPFFTTKSKDRGTGLGLLIVHDIVSAHNGVIELESKVNVGTTFKVYFPKNEKNIGTSIIADSQIVYGKGNILIVDDEDFVRNFEAKALRKLGYNYVEAKNGYDAIDILCKNEKPIDAIVLDMQMPGLDGFETYSKIKEINSNIPVLLASGRTDMPVVEKTLKLGARAVIAKPYSVSEYSIALNKLSQK